MHLSQRAKKFNAVTVTASCTMRASKRRQCEVSSMVISQTVLILAGGTAVLSVVFGIRIAMRAVAGDTAPAPRPEGGEAAAGGSGAPDVAGVIVLPPLIFLGFLAAAAVLEAVVPLPLLAAHAIPRYLAGAAVAAGGLWAIGLVVPLMWVINVGVVAREERYLERKFGDAYRAYKARVRRWI